MHLQKTIYSGIYKTTIKQGAKIKNIRGEEFTFDSLVGEGINKGSLVVFDKDNNKRICLSSVFGYEVKL